MKVYEAQAVAPVQPISLHGVGAAVQPQVTKGGESFSEVFDRLNAREARFSKHAATRLSSREIAFTDEQISRVNNGLMLAGAKGIIDGLLLVDGVALVVNVPSATVVTAMDGKEKGVFTNIDGAVIV